MTIASNTNKHVYSGNGVTTEWPFTFSYDDSGDITLYLTDTDGTISEITTNYTLDTANSEVVYPSVASGLPALTASQKITIIRASSQTQEVDLKNQGPFAAEVIEQALDKLTMMVQDQAETLARTVKFPIDETPASTETDAFLSEIEAHEAAATAAKDAAVIAQGLAETARSGAESAQSAAESAEAGALLAQTAAETAQGLAETAQAGAELAESGAASAASSAATAAAEAAVESVRAFHNGLNSKSLFTIAYRPDTRTLTVTYGVGAEVQVNGVVYPKAGSESITHSTENGKHYFYYNSSGTLVTGTDPWDLMSTAQLSLIYYAHNSTPALAKAIRIEERHGQVMDNASHRRDHLTMGTQMPSGGILADFTAGVNSDAARSWSCTGTTLYDEDLETTLSAQADGGAYPYFWWDNIASRWDWDFTTITAGMPTGALDGGSASNMVHNDITAILQANVLTENTTNSRWINVWCFALPILAYSVGSTETAFSKPVYIVGQTLHTTLASAQSHTPANLAYVSALTDEGVIFAKVIFTRSGGNVTIAENPTYYRSSALSLTSGNFSPTNHSTLTNRSDAGSHPASAVTVDVTAFAGHLTSSEDTVQKALDKIDDLSLVSPTGTQTLTNKTFDDAITAKGITQPANPSAGYVKIYAKSDDKIYKLTSAGVESEIGSGGGGGSGAVLQTVPSTYVATMLAGEAIAIRDAVCLDLDNSGNYRVFKTDYTKTNRHSTHVGFATAAATVTPHIQTWTISAAFVASNVIAYKVNGQVFSTTYASSSDATLQAIATNIASNGDVASATVTVVGGNQTGTDDRVITITGRGGIPINITGTGVTGGASQPTITLATTQAGTGDSVTILRDGPLVGFSGLTTGARYYAGNSAGSITNAPSSTNPVLVGQAIATDTVWAFPKTTVFATPVIMVESHGYTNTQVATASHFNFTSWSAQTSDSTVGDLGGMGEGVLGLNHHYIDFMNAGGSATTKYHGKWNKTAWSTDTQRTTGKCFSGMGVLGSTLHLCRGANVGVAVSAGIDSWNGVSWTNGAGTMVTGAAATAFSQGGYVHSVGGSDLGANAYASHETWNGSAVGSATSSPQTTLWSQGAGCGASSGYVAGGLSSYTGSYVWNGSAWSSVITMNTATNAAGVANNPNWGINGYNAGANMSFIAGGYNTSLTTVQTFNGVAYSTTTAMGTGKRAGGGGCF